MYFRKEVTNILDVSVKICVKTPDNMSKIDKYTDMQKENKLWFSL